MADIIATGTSGYATGAIDTATTLINGVSPRDAKHPNGCAAGVVQIETILGSGTSLKGSAADLVARLAILMDTTGRLILSGFSGLVTDRGLLATSSTTMAVINHTPIGIIQPYAGSVVPIHWLLCDGTAVDRAFYAKLFAAIGVAYGPGDGSTTFNVPDLRGRIPVGIDGSAGRITSASVGGVQADSLGGVGGFETHTLAAGETGPHTHQERVAPDGTGITSTVVGATTNTGTGSGATTFYPILSTPNAGGDNGGNSSLETASTTGGTVPHSNTQPWLAIQYIIFTAV